MKLKRICKLEYDEKDQVIIPRPYAMRYDVYFIDNEDWLCIDEDDYTREKLEARLKERAKFRLYKDNGNGLYEYQYVFCPYIPISFSDYSVKRISAYIDKRRNLYK